MSATRKPRQIVGFYVEHDKSEKRMKKTVDNSIKAKLYDLVANPSYQNASYSRKPFFLPR